METEGLSDLTLIADHLSDEGNHNWARAVAAARRILVEKAEEIERLKGLLREAAEDMENWGWEGAAQNYREAGEVTK
jgi:hypothetical protein